MRSLIPYIIFVFSTLWMLSSCRDSFLGTTKQVLVMWPTDASDPAYAAWMRQLSSEFARQGVKAELHTYYGTTGYTYEGEQFRFIQNRVHELDSLGKRPDLIMAYGDFMKWLLTLHRDSLLTTIPMVCYGLKDSTWMPRMLTILEDQNPPPQAVGRDTRHPDAPEVARLCRIHRGPLALGHTSHERALPSFRYPTGREKRMDGLHPGR